MANEGLIDRATAVRRVEPAQLDQLLHPTIDPAANLTILTTGLPASPGAASGQVVKHEYHDLCRRAEVLACIAQGFGTPCLCDVTLQKLSTPH